MLGAGQKGRGLLGRECLATFLPRDGAAVLWLGCKIFVIKFSFIDRSLISNINQLISIDCY